MGSVAAPAHFRGKVGVAMSELARTQYYWLFDAQTPYGDYWYLKSPIVAPDMSGRGTLLGSVLERLEEDLLHHFPRPLEYLPQSEAILAYLDQNAASLGLRPGDSVKTIQPTLPARTGSRDIKATFSGQTGQIPGISIPLNLGMDFSLGDVVSLSFAVQNSVVAYIPTGVLLKLYAFCKGNPNQLNLGAIDRQYICDAILVADTYTVTVEQDKELSVALKAKLENIADASVKLQDSTRNSFTLGIKNRPFMIAISTRRWSELDPD